MAITNKDLQRGYPAKAATRDAITLGCTAVIGAAGAVAAVGGDRGISVAEANTGVYTVTFPPLNDIQANYSRLFVQVASAALTVVSAVVTAFDTANGTATVKTVDAAGAAAEPAVLDSLYVELHTTSSGTRQ